MSWLRMHPYAAACAAAGILVIIGAIIVESRSPAQPGQLSVWGGTGAPLLNPTSYTPQTIVADIQKGGSATDVSSAYIPPNTNPDAEIPAQQHDASFDSLLDSLTQKPGQKPAATTSADVSYAYSFIPQGLIAATTTAVVRTKEQQVLYTYGNDAASYIQTYEDSNRNAPTALKDQAEDRQNPQKIQAVKLVAAGLRTAGESLLGMEDLPAEVASVHKALAESYIEVGRKLSQVPDANGDDAFIAAVNAYNSAADTLVGNYVALASVFSLNGVKFSPEDPGSIFTFSGGGGL